MKTLVIVAHPNMKTSNVNKRFMNEASTLPDIDVLDLYAEYPDCDIDVKVEQERLLKYKRIVLQFPFYWYSSPPLLKQWFDKMLTPGFAYGRSGSRIEGLELVVATSVGSKEEAYTPDGYQKYTVPALLRPIQATCNLVKLKYMEPFMVYNADRIEEAALEIAVKDYINHILNDNLREYGMYESDYVKET